MSRRINRTLKEELVRLNQRNTAQRIHFYGRWCVWCHVCCMGYTVNSSCTYGYRLWPPYPTPLHPIHTTQPYTTQLPPPLHPTQPAQPPSDNGATGMLCGECKEGYAYSTSAQTCELCEGGSILATQITTVVVVVIMAASAVVYWAGWAELLLPERWRGLSVEDMVNLGTVRQSVWVWRHVHVVKLYHPICNLNPNSNSIQVYSG
jgi:hypothetical protein